MDIEVKIIKGIPKEQIEKFEDRVVYNTAIATREYTKSRNAFPYLTGKLRREEVAAPIIGSNKEYGLTAGVDYAVHVWKMNDVNWTNPNTKPQWYYSNFQEKGYLFLTEAVIKAKKEV
jgi:hypothetical protein